jgi:cell wall-associated NlpC family hydrolase
MTSQWLLGEVLTPLEERDAWLRCLGPDGYEGWTPAGGLLRAGVEETATWALRARIRSLGVGLGSGARPLGGGHRSGTSAGAAFAPWGARLATRADGALELPGGIEARAEADGLVTEEQRARRFPPAPATAARTAASWLGTPYLWGGRIREGVDCSGLVQSVYGMHGIVLPRDSGDQHRAGPALPLPDDPAEAIEDAGWEPGDLIFFAPEGAGVSHVAICLGGARIVHASETRGAVALDDLSADGPLARLLRTSIVGVTRPASG